MGFVRKPVEKREVEIIRRLKHVVKLPVMTIARAVGRHKKTVYACLKKTWKARAKGRPKGLSKKEVKHVLSVMRDLVKKANAEDEVTLAMIKKKARCTWGDQPEDWRALAPELVVNLFNCVNSLVHWKHTKC